MRTLIERETLPANKTIDAPEPTDDRRRVLLAAGALVAFAALVGIIVLSTGSGANPQTTASPAPDECLEAWNFDKAAKAFARHNAIFHNYSKAQVGYANPAPGATISADPSDGDCVVVFARNSLDPEILAAGQIERGGSWQPLSGLMAPDEVARLQSEAFDGANVQPTREGAIEPLPLAETS